MNTGLTRAGKNMNKLYRLLIIILLIVIALTFYSYANYTGAFVFIVFGLIFEIAFWLGFVRTDKRKP